MSPKSITCPACGQQTSVEKASTLYLLSMERGAAGKEASQPRSALLEQLSPAELHTLGRRLAPPSSPKQAFTRPVSPDMVVVVFSLVLPIFLYGIFTSQPQALWGVVPVLAAFYGVYLWQRGRILARFNAGVSQHKADEERIQRAIQRWMRLYYCREEDGVFLPGDSQVTPADQIMGRLMG